MRRLTMPVLLSTVLFTACGNGTDLPAPGGDASDALDAQSGREGLRAAVLDAETRRDAQSAEHAPPRAPGATQAPGPAEGESAEGTEQPSGFVLRTVGGTTRRLPLVRVDEGMVLRAFSRIPPPPASLAPASGSVRASMTPVKNQGDRGTCATFAAVALTERYVSGDLSEQCIVREIGGNDGASPDSRLVLLTRSGAINEFACPYHSSSPTANIPAPYSYPALVSSVGTRAPTTYRMEGEPSQSANALNHLKQAINQGDPMVITFTVLDNTTLFDSRNTRIDLPATLLCGGKPFVAGLSCPQHAVVVVGYDDTDQSFLIKNSWGTGWKDGGYGRMSYAYFQSMGIGNILGLNNKPFVQITKSDPRAIENLRLSVEFSTDSSPHADFEDIGAFVGTIRTGLNGWGGTWDGSKWVGDLLYSQLRDSGSPTITINKVDYRAIQGLRIRADFTVGGSPCSDYEDVGNLDEVKRLALDARGGTWDGSRWVGNFLHACKPGECP